MKEKKKSFFGLFFKKVETPEKQQQQDYSATAQAVPVGNMQNSDILCPVSFDEIKQIIEKMRISEKPCLVDITKNESLSQRFLDVLSGAVYALDGTVTQLNGGLFYFNPKNRI